MSRPLFNKAPSILSRDIVSNPLSTGWNIIDCLFPLGRGQRQLIIGDLFTGKETIIKGTIINQKRANRWYSPDGRGRKRLWCIYSCLGKRGIDAKYIENNLKLAGAMWYTHILSVRPHQASALLYLSSYEGCAMGECLRDIGYHSLVVYDKMNNHAKAYRQMTLLIKNPPGREAYPGDIFFQQARLLERAAQMARKYGYGSLTAFPVYETQLENIRTYIATNLISITDGQIYLSKKIFQTGLRPAIDIFKSVSRVGSKAQPALLTWASKELQGLLISYFNTEQKVQMGFKLKKKQKKRHNKATSALGVWKQRIQDLNSYEEQVIMNLALACCHLCCIYPVTSVKWLLKYFNLKKNKWFSEKLLWLINFDIWEIDTNRIVATYYFIQKQMPTLFKLKTKIEWLEIKQSNYKHTKKGIILNKFKIDTFKCLQITLENFPNLFPDILPLTLLLKEVEIGKVYAADVYSITVEKFIDARYGATLETIPSHVMALILKIDSKYTYAALLEKSREIKPGDFVVLKDISIDIYDPLDIFGSIGTSRIIKKKNI